MGAEVGSEVMFDTLLDLQEHDTATDRLRHRRETLEERGALRGAETRLGEVDSRRSTLVSRRDEVVREEQRFDDEARSLEERASEVERTMYSGEIASPRELQAMQADVDQLRRHQRGIEDRELGVMEQREALDAELAKLDAEAGALESKAEQLRNTLAQAEAAIDAELGAERAARDELAARLSTELLDDYERCRRRARGVGAARLVGGTCQGCHLSIPSTEAERIRKGASGAVAHCDNCGCILVP
ncbi:MAG: zinc ribbon domain-containing protein [Acidimicrobiia bacterium]